MRVSKPRSSRLDSSTRTYRLSAGAARPALSVNACTTASGNIVTLWPGMYTVDRRSRAVRSSAESGAIAKLGAAM